MPLGYLATIFLAASNEDEFKRLSNESIFCHPIVSKNLSKLIKQKKLSTSVGDEGGFAPMINNKQDCERFVSYCYYPPIGQRSFGPMRAQLIHGSDYFSKANENILSFAMIETQEAVDNLDDILSVPNLTGVYIGPADMSVSYGMKPKFDVNEDPVFSNIKLIAKKANEKGKIAGIHNGTTQYAKEMIDIGFKLVTISSDFRSMSAHAQSVIDDMKEKTKDSNPTEAY